MVIHIVARHFLQRLCQTVETALHPMTLIIVFLGRLATHLYREIDARMEARHELEARPQLDVIADRRRQIEADAGGAQADREIEVIKVASRMAKAIIVITINCFMFFLIRYDK